MKTKAIVAALAMTLATGTVNAAEVRDIVLLTHDQPACRDISDTQFANEVGDAQGRAMLDSFIASSRGSCSWIFGGQVRYVAEKRPTRLPVPSPEGWPVMAFCVGELIEGTNREDHTKPCQWVYMIDRPTGR